MVAPVGINSYDFRAMRDRFAAAKFEIHAVVAIFAKLVKSLIIQPVLPITLEMVNRVVDTRGSKVFLIDWIGIVVPLNGQNSNVSVFKRSLDHFCDCNCVVGYLL